MLITSVPGRASATLVLFLAVVHLTACSDDGGMTEAAGIRAAAKRITLAMKPCDDLTRQFQEKPSKAVARAAAKSCLDASGKISEAPEPSGLGVVAKSNFEQAWKECTIAAGARSAWLSGIADPELRILDGEDNAILHTTHCIDKLTAVAEYAGVPAEEIGLLPPSISARK